MDRTPAGDCPSLASCSRQRVANTSDQGWVLAPKGRNHGAFVGELPPSLDRVRLRAGTARVFPFSFGRQAIEPCGLLAEPLAILARGNVRHADRRLTLPAHAARHLHLDRIRPTHAVGLFTLRALFAGAPDGVSIPTDLALPTKNEPPATGTKSILTSLVATFWLSAKSYLSPGLALFGALPPPASASPYSADLSSPPPPASNSSRGLEVDSSNRLTDTP